MGCACNRGCYTSRRDPVSCLLASRFPLLTRRYWQFTVLFASVWYCHYPNAGRPAEFGQVGPNIRFSLGGSAEPDTPWGVQGVEVTPPG